MGHNSRQRYVIKWNNTFVQLCTSGHFKLCKELEKARLFHIEQRAKNTCDRLKLHGATVHKVTVSIQIQ